MRRVCVVSSLPRNRAVLLEDEEKPCAEQVEDVLEDHEEPGTELVKDTRRVHGLNETRSI